MTSFSHAETLAICDGWDEGVWQPSCGTRLGLPRHGKGICLPRLYPSLQLTWALDSIRSQQRRPKKLHPHARGRGYYSNGRCGEREMDLCGRNSCAVGLDKAVEFVTKLPLSTRASFVNPRILNRDAFLSPWKTWTCGIRSFPLEGQLNC